MAGAKKHMERSHRSVSQKRNEGIFNDFERKAYYAIQRKASNKSLGQTVAQAFKGIFKRTKAC